VELAPTPGALLTTLPGIAIPWPLVSLPNWATPARRRALRRLTSYGGLAPRLKQTGGPEKEARTRGVSRRANYTLRTLLFLLAHQIDQHGHPELKADYNRRRDAGQRVQFTMARRMLRIVLHVLDHRDFFVPPSLVHSPAPGRAPPALRLLLAPAPLQVAQCRCHPPGVHAGQSPGGLANPDQRNLSTESLQPLAAGGRRARGLSGFQAAGR
jgi:hypothetical protein